MKFQLRYKKLTHRLITDFTKTQKDVFPTYINISLSWLGLKSTFKPYSKDKMDINSYSFPTILSLYFCAVSYF